MATVDPTISWSGDFSVVTVTYTDLENGDDGTPFRFPEYPDRSVQVTGTFASDVIDIEGSLDGANFTIISDPQGTALEITAAHLEAISENTAFTRPKSTGAGGGTTTTNVVFVCRRDRAG